MDEISYSLEIDVKKDVLADSYYEFFKWAFKILLPNETLEDNFHIKYICDLLQSEAERILRREEKLEDLIINIPPRASKSLLTSICFLPWVWIKNPYATFICVSFDDDLSNANSRASRDLIRNEEYQLMFGDKYKMRKDIDGVEMYQNSKGGFRLSKTTGANITGHKGLFLICDDIQNPKTAESEVKRKDTTTYYTGSLYNRLTPVNLGVRMLIMQRLHEEDATGYLIKKNAAAYKHICLPAEDSKDVKPIELRAYYRGGLLDPNRLSEKTLKDFKIMLGTRGYTGQYAQRPSPEEGGIIKKEWFDVVSPEILTRDIANEPIHFFIDSAYTEKTTNDPTAILTCFKKNGIIYIVDVVQVWMEFPELIRFIGSYTKRYQLSNDSKIFIEPKASGTSIAQTLRSETSLNVVETKAPDTDKVIRANAASPKMESRRVKLVYGMYIEDYVNQLAAFPNAAHDDMVDTTVNAIDTLLPANDNPDFLFLPMQ